MVNQYRESGAESEEEDRRYIVVGVCAMAKKVKSKPMKEILYRLEKFSNMQILLFDENMIIHESIEKWPICDALISFYSHGFPLKKAIEYVKLRKPYLVNDLEMQFTLRDRRRVYETLKKADIAVPRYTVLDRDPGSDPAARRIVEHDDCIEVNGTIFNKPFVEKPVDAEDHNIYIYFPSTAGGGSQRLFRKIGDRSSKYFTCDSVRMKGSYIYEEFMPTDGTDVKVYTVGDDYAHAEARKSPALDGKVERDSEGKEVRYPVILTPREKIIAKKVSQAFKQQICGFDLLRGNGFSFVCDVNGFSFVKSSQKYYDDSSHILCVLITRTVAPQWSVPMHIPRPIDETPLVATTCGTLMELRCVIAVLRHGDRTPKQKMKMEVKHPKFFELFRKYASPRSCELKLKKPKHLQEILDIVRGLLIEKSSMSIPEVEEKRAKFEQLRNVLEMYGKFSGINRKVQLKYQPMGRPARESEEEEPLKQLEPSLLLIVKWGGELTEAGIRQAEELGRAFRCIYPGGEGDYGKGKGTGLLRLHSTYRHDLKIYASDEGRVQMTAAAFAKGFLALEGELPPILVQMVKSANTNGLLDSDNDCRQYQSMVKKKIKEVMTKDEVLTETDINRIVSNQEQSLLSAMKFIENPRRMCDRVHDYIERHNQYLRNFTLDQRKRTPLYHGESWELVLRRWGKLLKDFKQHDGTYNVSKIPDIYDNIKYDYQHNPTILNPDTCQDFFTCSKALADLIVPQEYGITKEEKLLIGQRICTPLMRKILADARYTDIDECTRLHAGYLQKGYSNGVASPERFVRSRLYFTSESHLHSLLTCIRYGGLVDPPNDEQWQRAMNYAGSVSEINYLSQIVIMIYEDPSKTNESDEKFHVELHFSPGAYTLCKEVLDGTGYRPMNTVGAHTFSSMMESCTDDSPSSSSTSVGPASSATSATTTAMVTAQSSVIDEPAIPSQDEDTPPTTVTKKENIEFTIGQDPLILSDQPSSLPAECPIVESAVVSPSRPSESSVDMSASGSSQSSSTFGKFQVTKFRREDIDSDVWTAPPLRKGSVFQNKTASVDTAIYKLENLSMSMDRMDTRERKKSWSEIQREIEEENQQANYMTYPSRTGNFLETELSRVLNAYKYPRSLISTAVISGGHNLNSSSAPDLKRLKNNSLSLKTPSNSDSAIYRKDSVEEVMVPSAPCVAEIYPLETLHNALTLHQLDAFLCRLTTSKFPTPWASPRPPSTPVEVRGSACNVGTVWQAGDSASISRGSQSEYGASGSSHPAYNSTSAVSFTSDPPSPTYSSDYDQFMQRLAQIHRERNLQDTDNSSVASYPPSASAPGNTQPIDQNQVTSPGLPHSASNDSSLSGSYQQSGFWGSNSSCSSSKKTS